MRLDEQFQLDLNTALKARDKTRVDVLRMLRSKLQGAEIAASKPLDDSQCLEVVNRYAKQVRESIDSFVSGGRDDLLQQARAELTIVESYLPAQLGDDELRDIVKQAIATSGASSAKEMGKVMSLVMPQTKGRADGKKINQLVKELLG